MSSYVWKRVGQALLVLWAAFTASFLLLQALPGDAVLIKFMAPDMGLKPDEIALLRQAYGADEPFLVRYLQSLWGFLTGDFGFSLYGGIAVRDALATAVPSTLRLALTGFIAASLLALLLAWLSTLPALGWLRRVFRALPALLVSIPVFWLGIMLIQIFSFRLGWISVISPGEWEALVLPTLTLAVPIAAPLAQILIRNIDATLSQPYVAVARAKGAGWQWVLWRHVARNALLPTLTIAGVLFGELLAGAVVTEAVFGLSGLGGLTQVSVDNQDVAVLQALVVIAALGFVVINLAVDLLYPILDPRLRQSIGVTA